MGGGLGDWPDRRGDGARSVVTLAGRRCQEERKHERERGKERKVREN